MNKYKIYVIHGYTATKDSNWFPFLKNELQNDNIEVIILNMPNSHNPRFREWINHMDKLIPEYNENSIFVGHSLGCVTLLNYLTMNKSKKIKALYLISGFVEKTPIPELLEFVQPELIYDDIINLSEHITVISAIDDDIIPFEYSKTMAQKLNAKFKLLKEGKHFIDRDQFTEFPYLVSAIKKILI